MSANNVIGASIFTCYVIAALALTAYILSNTYRASRSTPTRSDVAPAKIQVVSAAAAISFSVLSYHMLSFLLLYYKAWAIKNDIPLPQNAGDILQGKLQVWTWLKDSALFLSFAETICNDPARFWWTQSALGYSIGWSVFMASDGARRGVPHLWAYFALIQILPTSFTQNLYALAALFQSNGKSSSGAKVLQGRIRLFIQAGLLALVFVYIRVLQFAADNVRTVSFMPSVLATRFLLFAPYILLASPLMAKYRLHLSPKYTLTIATVSLTFVMAAQLLQCRAIVGCSYGHIFGRLKAAINDDPSVSALGYDSVIGITSLAVFGVFGVLA